MSHLNKLHFKDPDNETTCVWLTCVKVCFQHDYNYENQLIIAQ